MQFLNRASFVRVLALAIVASVVAVGQELHVKFTPAAAYDTAGANAASVATADLRGDGKLDLVVVDSCQSAGPGSCQGTGEVAVLLGNGDGTFRPALTFSTGAFDSQSVSVADVNKDGILDLTVASLCQDWGCNNGAVSVLLGNGDGTFQPAVVYSSGDAYTWSVAVGDLRSNGKSDVVVSNEGAVGDNNGSVSVLVGNGDGGFQPAVTYSSGGLVAASVAIGDLNHDGIPDLVCANYGGARGSGDAASVMLGNGDGTFQTAVAYDSGGHYANSVALEDLRGNGILDMVLANGQSDNESNHIRAGLGVLLGNGDGTFQSTGSYVVHGLQALSWPFVGSGIDSLIIADVNGDGIPDISVIELCHNFKGEYCEGDGQVNVMLGNGDGTFQAPVLYISGGYGGSGLAVADVNGDGRPDLIAVSEQVSPSEYEGTISVFLNETYYASKTKLSASPNPAHVSQVVTFTATVTPTPPNGEVVTFLNGKTNLGTSTTKKGVASLTASFPAAKTYTIKASYVGDAFRKKSSGTVKLVVNP
jgi:hypothetical protein